MPFLNYKTQASVLAMEQSIAANEKWEKKGSSFLSGPSGRNMAQSGLAISWKEIAQQQDLTPRLRGELPGGRPLLNTCMNPDCATGWLRLWRRRQVPRFEGQWACSPQCMRVLIEKSVQREVAVGAFTEVSTHQHRMPIGLVLLSQGWITQEQLRTALDAQRAAGKGRIGAWLMSQCNLSEERVTRALGMQWGCPVVPLVGHQPEMVATLVPRVLLDTYGMVPVRAGSGSMAYLAFEDRADSQVALAVGRMSGLRVESAVASASQFLRAHTRMMSASFPKAQMSEVRTAKEIVDQIAQAVERVRPFHADLVRMRHYFWLRLWRAPRTAVCGSSLPTMAGNIVPRIHQVEDVLIHMRSESA